MKNKVILLVFLLVNLFCAGDSSAQLGWQWGMGSVHSSAEPLSMINDRWGNIFVACQLEDDSAIIGTHIIHNVGNLAPLVIIKTDSSGNYLWSVTSKNSLAAPVSSAIDATGNLYVLGAYSAKTSTTDSSTFYIDTFTLKCDTTGAMYFLLKISPSGNVLWAKNVAVTNASYGGIGVDKNSNVYVTGDFIKRYAAIGAERLSNADTSGRTTDIFLAKYDSSGNPIWAESFGGAGTDNPFAIAVGDRGNIYMAGMCQSINITIGSFTLTNTVYFLAKFNSGGACTWAEKVNGISTSSNAMVIDASENIYMTGVLNGGTMIGADSLFYQGVTDAFVAKYDSSGKPVWANSAGGTGMDLGYCIAVDSCTNVWVCGAMGYEAPAGYSMNFNGHTLTEPTGSTDAMFIAGYDHYGKYITSMALPSGGDDYCGIVVDNKGNFYVGGDYFIQATMIFGDSILSSLDTPFKENLFVAKYRYTYDTAPCPSYLETKEPLIIALGVTLYPNPAANECTIQSGSAFPQGSVAELFDLAGRLINSYPLSGNSSVISLIGVAPGMYQCRITTRDGVVVKKLVVMK
jgi:type IX secretion system substrate protein